MIRLVEELATYPFPNKHKNQYRLRTIEMLKKIKQLILGKNTKKENNNNNQDNLEINKKYFDRFSIYAFNGNTGSSYEQYEAIITRWYHTIEKGLSFVDYRPGFGEGNIDCLLSSMMNFLDDGFNRDSSFFKTALCVLNAYVKKNKEYGIINPELEKRITDLGGEPNDEGGTIQFIPFSSTEIQRVDYLSFVRSRHSMRYFSRVPVDIERIIKAIDLAQCTPSACNRQGWKVRIVTKKELILKTLSNQNGNTGFSQEIDKLLIVTADLRYFNAERELFQPYIDGGMYAQSLINALHYYNIATIPLSAALYEEQETNVREIIGLDDAEVLILFIGTGNYPDLCQTTKSKRHEPRLRII